MAWGIHYFWGQQLLVLRARVAEASPGLPGTLYTENRKIFAGCGQNSALELIEVQPGGKKRMSAQAFINGYKPVQYEKLGGLV